MKSYTIPIAILTLVLLSTSYGQKYFPEQTSYSATKIEVAAKHYFHSLDSENEGIIISALAQIGRMKLYFPEENFTELEKKIEDLSINGPTTNIRYRAFLVSNLFHNPATFASIYDATFEDSDALFTALSDRLNTTLLGSNSPR